MIKELKLYWRTYLFEFSLLAICLLTCHFLKIPIKDLTIYTLVFFCSKALIPKNKQIHYKKWQKCAIYSFTTFVTMALLIYGDLLLSCLFVVFFTIITSEYADYKNLMQWNPKNKITNMQYNDLIVKRIEELRKEKKLSYNKLAKKADLSYSSLMSYVTRTNPSTSTLIIKKICDGLEIKEYEFYNHDYFR